MTRKITIGYRRKNGAINFRVVSPEEFAPIVEATAEALIDVVSQRKEIKEMRRVLGRMVSERRVDDADDVIDLLLRSVVIACLSTGGYMEEP